MTGIYGKRSIIPNNYYFTFDKIYDNEKTITKANGILDDNVLIGRAVLALDTHSVYLKTVKGYIKVAILDNEDRFLMLEGYVASRADDIDNLFGNGGTYNGNGLYIINFNEVSMGYPLVTSGESIEDKNYYDF